VAGVAAAFADQLTTIISMAKTNNIGSALTGIVADGISMIAGAGPKPYNDIVNVTSSSVGATASVLGGGGATATLAAAGTASVTSVTLSGLGLGIAIGSGVNNFPAGNGQSVKDWWSDAIWNWKHPK